MSDEQETRFRALPQDLRHGFEQVPLPLDRTQPANGRDDLLAIQAQRTAQRRHRARIGPAPQGGVNTGIDYGEAGGRQVVQALELAPNRVVDDDDARAAQVQEQIYQDVLRLATLEGHPTLVGDHRGARQHRG